jgi:hypothetical protein
MRWPSSLSVLTISWVAASGAAAPIQARPNAAGTLLTSTHATATAGWKTHTDPAGFSIDTPTAWSISRDALQGRITVRGQRGEQVVVWPMFIDGPPLSARGAVGLVQQFARRTDAQLTWRPAGAGQAATGNFVRVVAPGQAKSGAAMMTWSSAPNGTAVLFYCVEAPGDVYQGAADTFAGILKSFRVNTDSASPTAGANSASADASLQFVQWNEPHEHMFSTAVPQGWRVLGGAYRLSATDVRTGILLSSPDNRIRVVLGDANIPMYISPSQMLAYAGLHEGGTYGLGDGTRMEIRRYISGQAYARLYAQTFALKLCSGLQVASNNARQDLTAKFLQAARAEGLPNPQMTAGDVSFTCTQNGVQVRGSMVVATIVPVPGPSPMWSVYRLYGYIAAPGVVPTAERVVERALDSVRLNAAWQAQQHQIAGNAVAADNLRSQQIQSRALAAIREDQLAINNTIVKGYEERSKVYDEVSRRRENAILGTLDVVDPESGTRYKVSNYSDYHWMNNSGVIAGNNTGTSPGPDWHELITLPW